MSKLSRRLAQVLSDYRESGFHSIAKEQLRKADFSLVQAVEAMEEELEDLKNPGRVKARQFWQDLEKWNSVDEEFLLWENACIADGLEDE